MELESIKNVSNAQNWGKTAQKVDIQAATSVRNQAVLNVTESNQATNQGTDNENAGKDGQASERQIKSAIVEANNKMRHHMTRCEFSYHEETNRVSIKVVDKSTNQVIREIPPEETLDMIQKMWELAGILVDEKR